MKFDHRSPSPSLPATVATRAHTPLDHFVTAGGMRVSYYALALEQIPADFFADPDGAWSYELLSRAAGFAYHHDVAIGALRSPFNGHPEGAAVVTLNALSRPYVAIVECPISYQCVHEPSATKSSAA